MNVNDIDWKKDSIVIGCVGKHFVCSAGEGTSEETLFFDKVSDILFSTEKFKETVYRYMYPKSRALGLNLANKKDFYELVEGDHLLSVLIEDDFLMSSRDMTKENMEKIRPVAKLLANLYAGSGQEFKQQESLGVPGKILVPVDDNFVCVGEDDTISFLAIKHIGQYVGVMLNVGPYGKMVSLTSTLFKSLSFLGERLLEFKNSNDVSVGNICYTNGKEFQECDKQNDKYVALCNLIKIGLGDEFSKMREQNHGVDGKTF